MESLNHYLFLMINATPVSPDWLIDVARWIASDLITIVPIILIAMWFWSSKRKLVINTATALTIAVAITTIVRDIYPHARPFVEGVGYQFLNHSSSSSFPSNHGTVIFTFALSFLFWDNIKTAAGLLMVALLIAWSRVYLGIHWPMDMVGAAIVATMACLLARFNGQRFGEKILRLTEHFYRLVFSVPIRKGWVRS